MTFTAPGEREHFLPNGERCPCTPSEGVDLGEWNASMGQRWTWMLEYLRREFGAVDYFKGNEVQQRGALHLHALMRCPADLVAARKRLRELAIRWGFGHEVDVQALDLSDPTAAERAAFYVSKYVSKTAGDRMVVPWAASRELLDMSTGELVTVRVRTVGARCRSWSASRGWGLTMRQVREAQAAWAAAAGGGPRSAGSDGADDQGAGDGRRPAPLDPSTEVYTQHQGGGFGAV